MGIFDKLFGKNEKPANTDEKPKVISLSGESTIQKQEEPKATAAETPKEEDEYRRYSDEEITDFVNEHIDRNGLKGLSKEETELAKPFFDDLFIYFHNNAMENDHGERCSRRDCYLRYRQPVFLTSSKVLCKNCAPQYLIDNCRNWYKTLDNFAPFAGWIPSAVQNRGTKIKEQITELRHAQTDNMSDEELIDFVLDEDNDLIDFDTRIDAMMKIRSEESIAALVGKTESAGVMLKALEHDLPEDCLITILNKVKGKGGTSYEVRRIATSRLSAENMEAVVKGIIPGDVYLAVGNIKNKELLEEYIRNAKSDFDRKHAEKVLAELEG